MVVHIGLYNFAVGQADGAVDVEELAAIIYIEQVGSPGFIFAIEQQVFGQAGVLRLRFNHKCGQ